MQIFLDNSWGNTCCDGNVWRVKAYGRFGYKYTYMIIHCTLSKCCNSSLNKHGTGVPQGGGVWPYFFTLVKCGLGTSIYYWFYLKYDILYILNLKRAWIQIITTTILKKALYHGESNHIVFIKSNTETQNIFLFTCKQCK